MLAGNFNAVALHAHHIQNNRMMNHPINRRKRGHGIFKNLLPFREDEIGSNHDRLVFVALSQEGKEHLHFIAVLLNIADIIQNDTGKLVQAGEFLGQAQITLSGKQALYQASGTAPKYAMTLTDQLMTNGSQGMAFSPSIEMPS